MSKDAYNKFSTQNPNLPFYYQEWWLNALYNNNWECLIYQEGEEIIGIMPYSIKKTLCFKTIMPPLLSPYQGPYLSLPQNIGNSKTYSIENKALQYFSNGLNKLGLHFYTQKFNPQIKNWLGFLWNGFRSTTHYTYRFTNLENIEETFNQIDKEYRRKIRKTQDQVFFTDTLSTEEVYKINILTYQKQNKTSPFSFEYFSRLDKEATKQGKAIKAGLKDKEGNILATNYLIIDNEVCYQLFSASDTKYSQLNAPTLLLWHSLQYANQKGCKIYDFTGSIMPQIETFIRHFGAEQTPYFYIEKQYSKIYSLLRKLKR